jgi:hypothetical protein
LQRSLAGFKGSGQREGRGAAPPEAQAHAALVHPFICYVCMQ